MFSICSRAMQGKDYGGKLWITSCSWAKLVAFQSHKILQCRLRSSEGEEHGWNMMIWRHPSKLLRSTTKRLRMGLRACKSSTGGRTSHWSKSCWSSTLFCVVRIVKTKGHHNQGHIGTPTCEIEYSTLLENYLESRLSQGIDKAGHNITWNQISDCWVRVQACLSSDFEIIASHTFACSIFIWIGIVLTVYNHIKEDCP